MSYPSFILYASDGVTPVYEFANVTDESGIFDDPTTFSEHTSLRGQGSIISEGSLSPFDITLTFVLLGTDYDDLTEKIEDVLTKVVKFTPYILKVSKTPSSTKDIKVKRLTPISFPYTYKQKRVKLQNGIITFRSLSW